METSPRLRQRIESFAKDLREGFGSVAADEAGCLLLPLEEWGVAVGDQLSRAVMEEQLDRRPDSAEAVCCPKCRRPARRRKDRTRRIETSRGAIVASEPEYYCSRCRRAFFP